jgi:hypothetical protein
MAMKIAVLEDNAERREAMASCLRDRFHQFEVCFFPDAASMNRFLRASLSECILISLDHDLDLVPDKEGRTLDPGTGREVADFLATESAVCPIIIHSTNAVAVEGMRAALRDAGWRVMSVSPFNDLDWTPSDWFRAVRRAIVDTAAPIAKKAQIAVVVPAPAPTAEGTRR